MQGFEATIAKFDGYGPPVHPNEAHTQGKMGSVATFVIDQFFQNGELAEGGWVSEMAALSIAGGTERISTDVKSRLFDALIRDTRHLDTRTSDNDRLEFQFKSILTPGTTALSLPWAIARGIAVQQRSFTGPVEKTLSHLTDLAHATQLEASHGDAPQNISRKRLGNILRGNGIEDPARHWHKGVWEWMIRRDDRFEPSGSKQKETLKVHA